MDATNMTRFQEHLRKQGLDGVLLSNPATITWLSGYAPPIQTGPSPFEGGPALGWWQDGELTLILSDAESGAAAGSGARVKDYLSYTIDAPINGVYNQAAVLEDVLRSAVISPKMKIGVEFGILNSANMASVLKVFGEMKIKTLDDSFSELRAIKSPAEVEKIQAALHLCDGAQRFVAARAIPGMSEIELWGALKADMEKTAGMRVPVLTDLVAGLRTADIGGLPGLYQIQPGDAIIADIVPRLNGYWGDNAGTHFVGQPAAELKKAYQVVLATLRKGVEMVRPGVRACDLDKMLRTEIQAKGYGVYPHHSGHGIGTTFHEEPRLVPYNQMALQEGMVVAIEPGIYLPGVGGVRLEDVVLVTADGCQVLTVHLK